MPRRRHLRSSHRDLLQPGGCRWHNCDDGSACTTGDTRVSAVCTSGPLKDSDGGGHVDSACGGNDCNDTDLSVWSPPIEAAGLLPLTESPAGMSWDSQRVLAGPGTLYDLVSGSLVMPDTGVALTPADCLQNSSSVSYFDSRPEPAIGTGFWYLVRARNSCGTGTHGTVQRDTAIPACP